MGNFTTGADCWRPTIRRLTRGELVRLTVQLCAGVPAFNSDGALLNPDTTFAGTLAAAETIIDNNFNWYDKGTLLENLTTGTAISGLSVASEAAPRQLGAVRLNADTVVNFCGWTATEGGYRLTLADNEFKPAQFTPGADFAQGAALEVLEQPIIVSAQNDDSGRATGLFTGLLDAANPVYESMIEGHEDIPNCRIEFSIYQDGRAVFRARRYFDCLGAMAMNKGAAYVHSDSWREADSRYIKLVEWQAPPEYQFSEDGTNWHDQQQDADLYYHERRPGGQWGPAVKMKTGPTGAAAGFGTPTVAVESLPAGSDATASVTASGDNTAKVFSFNFGIPKGADGQNGTNGADGAAGADGVSSYTYVAYASDASGTGFSLTPTNALKFRAEIHTTTAIETPDAGDFAGATWVKYIGDDGTGAGDMTKSVYDTNDDGIVDHAAAADAVGATTAAQVADAVGKAHTHANKATLDKFGESGGKPTYNGKEIGGASNWNDITGKPETFPPSAHNHAITDVTGLEDALQNAGSVKSVNGQLPDESGNVTIETGGAVDESRLLPDAGPDDSWMHHSESMDLVTPTDMTSMQSADWTLTAENVQENFSGKPWGLFDSGSYGFYIDGSGPATCTWTRRDGTPTLIDRLKIYTGSPSNNNGDSYEFYGSQDGNNWTLLGSWSANWNSDSVKDTETNLNVLTLEVLSNSTKYLHYKFSANSPILECLKGYGVTAKNEWKKLPAATVSTAGLMAAADKAAIAGLTTHGIYPNALAKSGAVDFNEVIDHGMYLIGGDTPHLNYPETYQQNGGTLQVIRNGNYLTQTFIPLNINKAFVRSCLNALSDSSELTFSAWRRQLIDTDITESKTSPGYFKLPGGTIVQWGDFVVTADPQTQEITLPVALSSAYVRQASGSNSSLKIGIYGGTNGKITCYVEGSTSGTVNWMVIGK